MKEDDDGCTPSTTPLVVALNVEAVLLLSVCFLQKWPEAMNHPAILDG